MKVLVIKANTILLDKSLEDIRLGVLNQIENGGVIVLDQLYDVEVMEFDAVKVIDSVD